jgi:hypothetical protein
MKILTFSKTQEDCTYVVLLKLQGFHLKSLQKTVKTIFK